MLQDTIKLFIFFLIKLWIALHIYIGVFASQQEFSLQISGMKVQGQRDGQQDFFYVRPKEQAAEDGYCAGVFDGHGDYGDTIAKTAERLFFESFEKYHFKEGTIEKYLIYIFDCVNNQLKQLNQLQEFLNNVNQSGTTASIAYKLGTLLYIAYVGDSRAVWGKNVDEQTVDHSTQNEKELSCYRSDEYYKDEEYGITRLKNIESNYTRALGDFDAEELTGWSAKPEIKVINLQKNPIIIMGSDGLWDCINIVWKNNKPFIMDNNNTIAYNIAESNLKSNHNSTDVVCKKLIRQAIILPYDGKTEGREIMNQDLDDNKFIMQYEGRTLGDNTTVVIIHANSEEKKVPSGIKPSEKKDKIEDVIEPEQNEVKGTSDQNLKETGEENKKNQNIEIVNIDKKTTKNKPKENLSNKRSVTFMHIALMLLLCGIVGCGYWHYHAQNI
ncbi:MAG TPA: PP2C family protein-serine/threonine phosphatase [Patescibacteria group bacterium]|jgi:serine/threonine protein phosphatase PrpC|nr:PP2C family protein-serine/threonine phosphatase [Patescibacteria group bacterium]